MKNVLKIGNIFVEERGLGLVLTVLEEGKYCESGILHDIEIEALVKGLLEFLKKDYTRQVERNKSAYAAAKLKKVDAAIEALKEGEELAKTN